MAKEWQIGCNLRDEEAQLLKQYALNYDLRRPSLCNILVRRAIRCADFSSLKSKYAGSDSKKNGTRVTARVSLETRQAFEHAAKSHGVGIEDAAAFIFREELATKWLASIL